METLTPGAKLDHYTILTNLGQGAFSTAYEARDERNGRVVVLKCPNPVLLGDTTSIDRFRREMAIGRRLKHPHIMEALDSGESRSAPYLVVEFIEGRGFGAFLRPAAAARPRTKQSATRGRFCRHWSMPTASGSTIAISSRAICSSTRRGPAQDHRLWHRLHGRHAAAHLAMGGQHARNTRLHGAGADPGPSRRRRSDIYATGAMLYEMLTGQPPFDGKDVLAVMDQHLKTTPKAPSQLNSNVPPGLNTIVLKALRKNPAERYDSAAAMKADLERYESLAPAEFDFPPEHALEPAHPDRMLVLIATAIALTFVGAASAILAVTHLAMRR